MERQGQSSIQRTQYERPWELVNLLKVGELAGNEIGVRKASTVLGNSVSPTCLTYLWLGSLLSWCLSCFGWNVGPIVIFVLGIKENKKKMRVASTVLTSSPLSFFSVYLLKSLSHVVFQLAPLCFMGFPCGLTLEESACSCRRPGFNPWIGKIPWRRERLPTPVFWPGELHGLYGPWGHKEFHFHCVLYWVVGEMSHVLKVRARNPLYILEAVRINTNWSKIIFTMFSWLYLFRS